MLLQVGNLPRDTREGAVRALGRAFGTIQSVQLLEGEKGFKGVAFLECAAEPSHRARLRSHLLSAYPSIPYDNSVAGKLGS